MRNIITNRILSFILAAILLCGILSGCGKEEEIRPSLTVWVFADQYRQNIEQSFCTDMSSLSWDVDIVTVPVDELDERLALAAEEGTMPDVFMLSPDKLPTYLESDMTADLGALGFAPDSNLYYDYTTAMSTSKSGELKALCWQPDPGMFFYRRSIAEAYLGTSEPAKIQDMICNWDGFMDTARLISERSEGKTKMLAGVSELVMPYLFSDPVGWVGNDGTFAMSPKAHELLDYAQKMHSEQLCFNAETWSEAWLTGIEDSQSVFGYFSSGIGMESILRKACGGTIAGEGSFGDWAAVSGPAGFNWGGCWFAVADSSDMKQQAAIFLEYFFSETTAMQKNCLLFGTFSPSRITVEQVKYDPQFADSFLSGQNYFVQMAAAADRITVGAVSPCDKVIDELFTDILESYSYGYLTREQAENLLYNSVQTAFPDLF